MEIEYPMTPSYRDGQQCRGSLRLSVYYHPNADQPVIRPKFRPRLETRDDAGSQGRKGQHQSTDPGCNLIRSPIILLMCHIVFELLRCDRHDCCWARSYTCAGMKRHNDHEGDWGGHGNLIKGSLRLPESEPGWSHWESSVCISFAPTACRD